MILNRPQLRDLTLNLKLELAAQKEFEISNPKIELIIQENETLARKLNIRGTPTFIINGKLYAGALELDKLKALIEKALSES